MNGGVDTNYAARGVVRPEPSFTAIDHAAACCS